MILEIDVKGARQVRERVPDALLDLPRTPVVRGAASGGSGAAGPRTRSGSARRLGPLDGSWRQTGWFDHVVVNDDLERAADEVAAIIEASRTAT